MPLTTRSRRSRQSSSRTLESLDLFPTQGEWEVDDFLELSGRTNRLIELSDGFLEVLPMPGKSHQRIAIFLFNLIRQHVEGANLGEVLIAPYPVRLWPGKVREPDIVAALGKHADQFGEDMGEGADFVVEVLSKDRQRDLVIKRREYAKAGIREYWIVDPKRRAITVLALSGRSYVVHGEFGLGENACSKLMAGFAVPVADVFTSASSPR